MARIRNVALMAVSILAVIAGWLGYRFEQQRRVAQEQVIQAYHLLQTAEKMIIRRHEADDAETKKEVQELMYGVEKLREGMDRLR
jgi:hypothetical protein